MGNSLKMLTIAASIFITCVVISFSIFVMHEGLNLGHIFVNGVVEKEKEFEEYKFTKFDTEILSGAEVINITRRFQDTVDICIDNGNGSRTYSISNKFQISDNSIYNTYYIEPYDEYIGSVDRNAYDRIIRLNFRKKW